MFKGQVCVLYAITLAKFKGIITATLTTVSHFHIRSNLNPEVLIVNKAGQIKEPDIIALITFYNCREYIVIRDENQLKPFVPISSHDIAPTRLRTKPDFTTRACV